MTFGQDLRYAIRAFRMTPGFTLAAVLSLALAIGANTSIFSVGSALLLRPFPYKDSDRLTILWNRSPGIGIVEDWFSTAQYFDIKNGHQGFEQLAIAIGSNYNLTGDGSPERIGTVRVSSNLLPMLGVQPALGRLFTEAEDSTDSPAVALLRWGTWMRRYGGDPQVIGKSMVLNGLSYPIVGVLPESFTLPREVLPTLGGAENAEVVLSLPLGPDAPKVRAREDYNIIGKLKNGVTVAQAQAEMETITARLKQDYPEFYPPNGGLTFSIVPLRRQVVGDAQRPVIILLGAGGFVLLIACANVANLLLSRALSRQKEIAVRAAVGASRGRIVRQLLTESVLLALAGGGLGVLLSLWSVQWIHLLGTRSIPRLSDVSINSGVLLFTLVISVFSGLLFGLAPAIRLGRVDLNAGLKDASRGSAAGGFIWGGHNMRRLLVVSELTLSVMLLIGAGLLIRSFQRLLDVRPGFNPSNVLTLELTMTGEKYNDADAVLEMYRQLWERIGRLPGVTGVGGVTALPLSQMYAWGPITIEGYELPPGEKFINADQRIAGGDYFKTMEIPLVKGRFFNEHDIRTNPRVVIIDEYMAEQYWPGQDPIGKRIRTGGIDSGSPWMTVVGVVGRVKQYTLDSDSRVALHFAQTQAPARAMNIVVRSSTNPEPLTASIREEIRKLDPDLPIYGIKTMSARVDESLARRRFSMLLLTLFAAVALGLASIGVYSVMAYIVSQSTRELGIRIALGATPGRVSGLILKQGIRVTGLGVGLGVAGSLVLTRSIEILLFEIDPVDPLTFAGISILLTFIALLASCIPARRAARIDPIASLRSE